MLDLKRTLDAKVIIPASPFYKTLLLIIDLVVQGHCILEMPCGTGKTVSLLALIIAYHIVRILKHNYMILINL